MNTSEGTIITHHACKKEADPTNQPPLLLLRKSDALWITAAVLLALAVGLGTASRLTYHEAIWLAV